MATNATPWPKMIRAVYSTFDTGQHANDHIARAVMDRIVSWLAAGKSLSPRLQSKLVDNINMRTRFRVEQPDTPIRLNKNQLDYARRTNPEWFGLGLSEEDFGAENQWNGADLSTAVPQNEAAFPLVFRTLSATIQHSFHALSAIFPQEALALAQRLVSEAAEKCGSGAISSLPLDPKVMEREGNEVNHEADMTCASHHLDFHEGQVSRLDRVAHELQVEHEPQVEHEAQVAHELQVEHDPQVLTEEHDGFAGQPRHDGFAGPTSSQGEDEEDRHGGRSKRRPTLTLWTKPDRAGRDHATGYFERDGRRFALRFTRFDHALQRIGKGDWHTFVCRDLAAAVLQVERARTGLAGNATMSGFYAPTDTWARKAPIFADRAILLDWENGEPTGALLVEGENFTTIELRRESPTRHKGVIA